MSNSKTKISLTSISDERFKIADSDKEMFKEKNGKNIEKINLTQKANEDYSENDIEIEEDENSDFSMENNEEVNKKADAESESIKEYDLIDDAISENLEDDKGLEDNTLDNYKEKVKRSGVIYISYIPEGMTVSLLRKKLQKYGANRVFLVPDTSNSKSKKRQNYKEGWIEFTDKIMAKLCEYEISGKIFGGKKRNNKFREEIWNLKYLNKFKWHHLMEKLQFNKKLREHRMKAELSQSKRENNFILEKFEQSRKINFLNKKRVFYSPKIIIKFQSFYSKTFI